MDELIYNNERLIDNPALDSQIENEHRHRYKTAARFAYGKRVLDAACGSGYGSNILAEQAQSVVGIDYSSAVIEYCNRIFQRENLSYLTMSAADLVFPDDSFDMVVSFETIEHLKEEDQVRFLRGIRRVLTEDGLLIMSSPNSDLWEKTVNHGENPHHLHELTFEAFRDLLSEQFKYVSFFYQNYQTVSLITDAVAQMPLYVHHSENYSDSALASYFIAVCSNRPLEENLSGIYLQETVQATAEKQLGFVEMNLYCDCGKGFTEADKIGTPVKFTPDGTCMVEFTLQKDASALRFDPGELPCTILDLVCSDPLISFKPLNGVSLEANEILFYEADPIFLLEGRNDLRRGEHISIRFGYRAGTSAKQFTQKSVPPITYQEPLQQDSLLFIRNAELAREYFKLEREYIILKQEHIASHEREQALEQQLTQSQAILSGILSSLSWRITAPIRKLMEWLRRRK